MKWARSDHWSLEAVGGVKGGDACRGSLALTAQRKTSVTLVFGGTGIFSLLCGCLLCCFSGGGVKHHSWMTPGAWGTLSRCPLGWVASGYSCDLGQLLAGSVHPGPRPRKGSPVLRGGDGGGVRGALPGPRSLSAVQ